MKNSEQLNEIAAALAKAQGAIKGAVKGSVNPAYRSKYADLQALFDAIREPFAANGLSVVQGISSADNGVECCTMLMHSSGQWISESLFIPADKHNAHGYASAATYAKRVALAGMSGCASTDQDDDGNAAVAAAPEPAKTPKELLEKATAEAAKGTAHYKAFYSMLKADQRAQLMPEHENLKKLAAVQTAKNPGDDK